MNPYHQNQPSQQPYPQYRYQPPLPVDMQPPRKVRYVPRIGWILFLAISLSVVLIILTVGIPFNWDQIMEIIDVDDHDRYTLLGLLGLGLIILTLIVKALRGRRDN